MKITYNLDKAYPELKEQLFFVDQDGEEFKSFETLREYLKYNDLYLISESIGNFQRYTVFAGDFNELQDFIQANEMLSFETIIELKKTTVSELNQYLKGL